jgi:copper(I)-binding protein
MTIRNGGSRADRLVAAQSDVADATEIHTVEMKDGVMAMRPADGVDVPAHGEVVLKPGGYHIMFVGMRRMVKPGDAVEIVLRFEQAGEITVQAEVREP